MEIKNGTVKNYENAVDTYSDMVYRIACHNLKSKADCDDVVQEVFIKLLQSEINYDNAERLKAWLIKVTINKCRDNNKSFWNRKRVALDEVTEAVCNETELSIKDEINLLPQKDRNIVYLYYFEEYSIKEIADILHMKTATVGSRLSRARGKLKILLEQEED